MVIGDDPCDIHRDSVSVLRVTESWWSKLRDRRAKTWFRGCGSTGCSDPSYKEDLRKPHQNVSFGLSGHHDSQREYWNAQMACSEMSPIHGHALRKHRKLSVSGLGPSA